MKSVPAQRLRATLVPLVLVLVLPVALVVSGETATAAAAAPTSRVVELLCDGVGTLPLTLGTTAPPGAAEVLPPGLTVQTAYRARDRRTGASVGGGTTGAVACGTVPLTAVTFRGLTGTPPPPGVSTADLFDGTVTVTATVTAAADAPAPVAAGPSVPGSLLTTATATPFLDAATIRSYLGSRSGHASLAVYEPATGVTHSYDGSRRYVTASIVKVAILGTLLRRAQDAGRSLTSSERALAARMIEVSDNAAASSLWRAVGGSAGVQSFLAKAGLTSTVAGPSGYWGLTTTTAPDQVRLMQVLAYRNTVLSDSSRGYADSLMRSVVASQRWGVSGGLPSGATVALKNGWLPRSTGWVVNSIGHVRRGNRDYVIAALSATDPGMGYGITTLEHLSGIVWGAGHGQRVDDTNRDHVSDVIARIGGTLKIYFGNGHGGFAGSRTVGSGWAGYTALVTPGDVTGDGNADLLMRDATGVLWLAPGNGAAGFSSRRRIGPGWNSYTLAPAGDLSASGRPDLLARDGAGVMWLFPITGNGVVGHRVRLGPGWTGHTLFTGAGDLTGDAGADVLARDGTGALWLFPGDGEGGLLPRRRVPSSWAGFTALVAPGDWDSSGSNDLLTRDSAGRLWFYPGTGDAGFGTRRPLGGGWTGMSFIG